jgi:hypothetical protein
MAADAAKVVLDISARTAAGAKKLVHGADYSMA